MFVDRLVKSVKEKGSPICVGLDPVLSRIPSVLSAPAVEKHGHTFLAAAETVVNFNKGLIDAVKDLVPVVKPQLAYFEKLGFYGLWAFEETCKYAKEAGLLVLADAKRGDIGSTASAYAEAFLGKVDVFGEEEAVFDADAVTVNPYMGYDSVKPFMDVARKHGKGVFALVKTTNDSSGDIQDRIVDESGLKIFEIAAHLVESWGSDDVGESGYGLLGAVVAGNHPRELKRIRELMPNTMFLIPGYGAQGGTAKDVMAAFDKDGNGAIINSARAINYAYENMPEYSEGAFAEAARVAVLAMKKDLGF